MTLQVGITGGIGSGKSYVSRIFWHLGVPVYEADKAGHRLLNENESVRKKVVAVFGEAAYQHGKANRRLLAEKVFNDPEKLKQLNSIIHPAVQHDYKRWIKTHSAPYVLKEAAILIESGTWKELNALILVMAPAQERISRVMQRDRVDEDDVLERMKNQLPDEEKAKSAQYIIENHDGAMLLPQVLGIHEMLLTRSGTS